MPRDILTQPLCRAEDLGHPAPDSVHAVSVALPLWEHVIGYEEEDPEVIGKLRAGYPRFYPPEPVRRLQAGIECERGEANERVMLFPVAAVAERCLAFVEGLGGSGRVETFEKSSRELSAVFFPDELSLRLGQRYWRFTGEGISSRLAEEVLEEAAGPDIDRAREAIAAMQRRLTELYGGGVTPGDVSLWSSGMTAIFNVHRILRAVFGEDRTTIQVGFPYVDALKVQEHWGGGAHLVVSYDPAHDAKFRELLVEERPMAVFCEVASNPLMYTVDLPALRELLDKFAIPLIVDDTVASVANVDVLPYADVVTSSLTKYFNGVGDVLAGAMVLNPSSPFYRKFEDQAQKIIHDPRAASSVLWHRDAVLLERQSRDFQERIARINRSAEKVFDYLAAHPEVERIWFPKSGTAESYRALRRDDPEAGYGGLISIRLKGREPAAREFYDRLRLTKGTSLGCNFTLVCPYTLLAHYQELDWAADCGVPRDLIRISVGLEDPDHLIRCFEEALG